MTKNKFKPRGIQSTVIAVQRPPLDEWLKFYNCPLGGHSPAWCAQANEDIKKTFARILENYLLTK